MNIFSQQVMDKLPRLATDKFCRFFSPNIKPGDTGQLEDGEASTDMKLIYVTTRQPALDSEEGFGAKRERSTDFHYGNISLSVANQFDSAVFDQQFSEWITNEVVERRQLLKSIPSINQCRKEIKQLKGDTLVYIHGYNMDFKAAVRSAVQWAGVSGFNGNLILFSWPSLSRITEYAADRETAVWSSKGLSTFLSMLIQHQGHRVHILAHSMGSVALTSALQMPTQLSRHCFENIILAAPDLDAELFVDVLWPVQKHLAKRWSVYYSRTDLALLASEKVNTNTRLGSKSLHVRGLDFIDASSTEFSYSSLLESHAYHDRKPQVVVDILQLISGKTPRERNLRRQNKNAYVSWCLSM